MGESGKLMKNLKSNIDVFDGRQSRFEDWVMKTTICFEHLYPLIAEIVHGKALPPEVKGYHSLTDQRGRNIHVEGAPSHRSTSTEGGGSVPPPPPPPPPPLPDSSVAKPAPRETLSQQFERTARTAAALARAEIAEIQNTAGDTESLLAGGADHTTDRSVRESDVESVDDPGAAGQRTRPVVVNRLERDAWTKANGTSRATSMSSTDASAGLRTGS